MKFAKSLLLLVMCSAGGASANTMYQCIDQNGHKTFSNVKPTTKDVKCTVMDLGEPVAVPAVKPPPAAPKAASPANFPKVDENDQKARDTDRRRILETELAAEQKNLEQAKKDLAEQEGTFLAGERNQGGGINGARVSERLQPFKDKVALHERNIEAIQKEISRLR